MSPDQGKQKAKELFNQLKSRDINPLEGGAGLPQTQTISLKGLSGEDIDLEISPNDDGQMSAILTEMNTSQSKDKPLSPSGSHLLNPAEGDGLSLVAEAENGEVSGSESEAPFLEETAVANKTWDQLLDEASGNEADGPHEEGGEASLGGPAQDPRALAALGSLKAAGVETDPEIAAIENAPDPFSTLDEEIKKAEEAMDSEVETVLQGEIEDYHSDGWLMSRVYFHLGMLHGPAVFFREDESIQEKIHFSHGKMDGPYEQFDEEGRPTVRLTYKEGMLWGRAEFYEKGQLITVVNYKENKLDGLATAYGDQGDKTAEISFKAGYQTGPLISYNENGHLNARMNFYQGVLQGEWQSFFDTGELLQEGSYNEGKKEGSFVNYYQSGSVSQVSHYANGKLIDVPMAYDRKGKEIDEY